jgi:glycosyltransferase involved in cell wall biosynthesis
VRVALYYPWIYLTSGAERTLVELSGRSRHHWTLFTNHYEPENTFPEFSSRDVAVLKPISVKRSIGATLFSAITIARQKLPLEGYDVLVILCEGLGDFAVFRNQSLPVLNICLTPLRIAFDSLYRERYDKTHGLAQRLAVRLGIWGFTMVMRRSWAHYDRVFCISRECLKRVLAGRLAGPDRLEILHVGVGISPPAISTSSERYFLVAGRIMWTKNIELAIEAFHRFVSMNSQFSDFKLRIAGIVDDKSRSYLARLQELAGAAGRIEFHVFPSDSELTNLYRDCYAVLFTPFNEDWGIVPIEAMAFGKPVIAVNQGGPLETVLDGVTGFLEEPKPAAFARRMCELAQHPELAYSLGRAGREHSQHFSWDSFVERIDREIEALAGPSKTEKHARDESRQSFTASRENRVASAAR